MGTSTLISTPYSLINISNQHGKLRGGVKKTVFFTFGQKGGGGSRPIQKILIRKYSDFFDQRGGGSHPIQKGFIRFFGIICQKWGFYIKKTGSFLTIFRRKGGGSGPSQKNPYQKKLRWSKKGEGGSQFFLLKVKKQFFMPPLSVSIYQ